MSDIDTDFRLPEALPPELPVMALIRGVLMPGTVAPYNVGRAASLSALDHAVSDLVLIVPQVSPTRVPSTSDLLAFGTIARLVRDQQRNGGRFVLAQGLARARILAYTGSVPHFVARYEVVRDAWSHDPREVALREALVETLREQGEVLGEPGRTRALLDTLGESPLLVDAVAAALELDDEHMREILATIDVRARGEKVLAALLQAREVEAARTSLKERLQTETRDRQREAFLRQQLEAIRKELGETDSAETDKLREQLARRPLPREVREAVDKELTRLERIPELSPERNTAVDWLQRIADLPWGVFSASDLDLDMLERNLDESHFGLDEVKRQVVEHLSVRKLAGSGRADVLLLVGPPGVGKTSIGQAIAASTGRRLVRVALGGVRDEAELRGHRRTYIGARPGRIIEGFRRAGTQDPVVLLDEVDKLTRGQLGDPGAALLEILDPEQNHTFTDHYLEVPFDLSRALFVATANDLTTIPAALRDRMEVLEIAGYTPAEKHTIAMRHLLAKAAENAGVLKEDVQLEEAAVDAIIDGWTREAGVRQLQRLLGRLYRAAAVEKARGRLESPLVVKTPDLPRFLKRARYLDDELDVTGRAGIATGLAWTPAGGEVLQVEASTLPGRGNLVLTGQLGDVMKESARAALTWVLANRELLGFTRDLEKEDIHLHLPAGAIPKDGPSAGVTMCTALASLFTGRLIRSDVAMTGEVTLRGRVLTVGGIKAKVLAAHRRGIRRIVLPLRNEADLEEVPEDVRRDLQFILVTAMEEVVAAALLPVGASEDEQAERQTRPGPPTPGPT